MQNNRTFDMIDRYGEVCTRTQAARILSCCPSKIRSMLADGRLDSACAGTMVDVRSLARYITAPEAEDSEARKRRIKLRHGSEYAV